MDNQDVLRKEALRSSALQLFAATGSQGRGFVGVAVVPCVAFEVSFQGQGQTELVTQQKIIQGQTAFYKLVLKDHLKTECSSIFRNTMFKPNFAGSVRCNCLSSHKGRTQQTGTEEKKVAMTLVDFIMRLVLVPIV